MQDLPPDHRHSRAARWFALAGLALTGALAPSQGLRAAPPEVRITADSELSFGTFMVFGPGSRMVTATGAVSDAAVVALEGSLPAPARFTVEYDRGNNDRKAIDVEIELVMSPTNEVRVGGVTARVSAFETDLPQARQIQPGRAVRIAMLGCRTRVCTQRFQLGGRLDVNRQSGGASVTIPIRFDIALVSLDRQNPGQGQGQGRN